MWNDADLTTDEAKALEAAARAAVAGKGGPGTPVMFDVLSKIDARRFSNQTDRLRGLIRGATADRYRAITEERAQAASPMFVISGRCQNDTRCSRNASRATPAIRDGRVVLVGMCGQHDNIARGYGTSRYSDTIHGRVMREDMQAAGLYGYESDYGPKPKVNSLEALVAFAKTAGANLTPWADDLVARGIEP